MPSTLLVRKSTTTGVVPSSLTAGELAINLTDGLCWVGTAGGPKPMNSAPGTLANQGTYWDNTAKRWKPSSFLFVNPTGITLGNGTTTSTLFLDSTNVANSNSVQFAKVGQVTMALYGGDNTAIGISSSNFRFYDPINALDAFVVRRDSATSYTHQYIGNSWRGTSDGTKGLAQFELLNSWFMYGATKAAPTTVAVPIVMSGTTLSLNATTGSATLTGQVGISLTATTGSVSVDPEVQFSVKQPGDTYQAMQLTATNNLIRYPSANIIAIQIINTGITFADTSGTVRLAVNTRLTFPNIPASATGLSTGMVWRNGNVLNIV